MQTATRNPINATERSASNDYHQLPVTKKQIQFARKIAEGSGIILPWDVQQDRRALSIWINENRSKLLSGSASSEPSSKQVAFAERIARMKRRAVPQECFRDRTMMSRWIDSNR